MKFFNGGFKWTVLALLTGGVIMANAVLTAVLQQNNAREVAVDAVTTAIMRADSISTAHSDSILEVLGQLKAGIEINQDRIYRYTPKEEVDKSADKR